MDVTGKVNCASGRCPDGFEEVRTAEVASAHCQACAAGSWNLQQLVEQTICVLQHEVFTTLAPIFLVSRSSLQALRQWMGLHVLHVCPEAQLELVVPHVKAVRLATFQRRWETANALFVMQEAMQQLAAICVASVHPAPILPSVPATALGVQMVGWQKVQVLHVSPAWLALMPMKGDFAATVPAIQSQLQVVLNASHVLVSSSWPMQTPRD